MVETNRQKQKKLTRIQIIETSLKMFGQNGILNTKTADIAKEAKVSHGTIFAHFSTQEQLIIDVIEAFGTRISDRLDQLLDTNSSLVEILEAHLNSLIEFEPFYTRLIIERRLLPASASNTYIMIQSTISFHIGLAAEKEIKKGIIRKQPAYLLFNTWIGLIHYYLTNSDLFSTNGSVLEEHGKELLNHYINLIKI